MTSLSENETLQRQLREANEDRQRLREEIDRLKKREEDAPPFNEAESLRRQLEASEEEKRCLREENEKMRRAEKAKEKAMEQLRSAVSHTDFGDNNGFFCRWSISNSEIGGLP